MGSWPAKSGRGERAGGGEGQRSRALGGTFCGGVRCKLVSETSQTVWPLARGTRQAGGGPLKGPVSRLGAGACGGGNVHK